MCSRIQFPTRAFLPFSGSRYRHTTAPSAKSASRAGFRIERLRGAGSGSTTARSGFPDSVSFTGAGGVRRRAAHGPACKDQQKEDQQKIGRDNRGKSQAGRNASLLERLQPDPGSAC
jgi:hypothetical protein